MQASGLQGQLLPPMVYSNAAKNTEATESPAITILCVSTPETIYGQLDESLSPLHIPHFAGAIAAPTEKHCGFIAAAMFALLETAGGDDELHKRVDPKPRRLLMGNGVSAISTGNFKQGHGADLDLAVIDECGLITTGQPARP